MKILLFVFAIFAVLKVNAQNYLISFTGTGASATVSSVKVENLTKSTSLILSGSDILHLTVATGINSIEDNQSSKLKFYPNPMNDNSTLEIYPPVAGNAIITVCDITGKQVTQIQSYLENSRQDFNLSGIKNGFYLVNVKGNSYQFTGKLLSNSNYGGAISIEKISLIVQTVVEKIEKSDKKGTQATLDMEYSNGDRLKFTGISDKYSTILMDIPASSKTITFNFISCTDGDNNNYPVVEIGNQIWMAENLKTTRYSNNDLIGTTSTATLDVSGELAPKYQWAYSGNEILADVYGRLYTWYAITDSRKVCPSGWHVATDEEWHTLILGIDASATLSTDESIIAGGKLKETGTSHWMGGNIAATNETGFSALPGGHRGSNGSYYSLGSYGTFFTATGSTPSFAWCRSIGYSYGTAGRGEGGMHFGFSVRCLKDN